MATNLFGADEIKEESFEIIYKGSSFEGGQILIGTLYKELRGVESLLKDSVGLMVKTGKIDSSFKDFQIYIEIDKGSIYEKIKVIFNKKNLKTAGVVGALIVPFLNTTYEHFLNGRKTSEDNRFYEEVQSVENDQDFKDNLKSILVPISNNDDNVVINNGTINLTINYSQKDEIVNNLDGKIVEDDLAKNGEFEEVLTGVIRKLDLDAANNNYFGFNIDNGQSHIPTAIKGEFNLNDYKEIINEHVKIRAIVKYKDGQIKHIEVLDYELLNKQGKLRFSM